MADPISISSGILTLVTFGLKASTSLYQTIKSFNSHQRNVRELREELEALNEVLTSLNHAVVDAETDFVALRLPLLRCGNACTDFEAIVNSAGPAIGQRTNFRGWARLKYMGDDITGFKNMLAGYKSTITIALCNANLRASAVTTNVLNEYQEKIEDTMSDLTDHLRNVDDRLQMLIAQKPAGISESETEWQNLRSEKESVQQCMNICADVAVYIDSVRPRIAQSNSVQHDHPSSPTTISVGLTAWRDTDQVLDRCQDDLSNTISQLQVRIQDLSERQQRLPYPDSVSQNNEQRRLQEEVDSVKQSLAICAEASKKAQPGRMNVFEDVSMTDDGHQIMVSTIGDLISARRVTAGARSAQWFGQMSDESLQQLSQGRGLASSKSSP